MTKKTLKLTDNRGCTGRAVRELRSVLRGIDSGEIVSVGLVIIRRDRSSKTFYDCDDAHRMLGAVDLLKDYIKDRSFKKS